MQFTKKNSKDLLYQAKLDSSMVSSMVCRASRLIVGVYVDNLISTGCSSKKKIDMFKAQMKQVFLMSDLVGLLSYYIYPGIEITQDANGITLCIQNVNSTWHHPKGSSKIL